VAASQYPSATSSQSPQKFVMLYTRDFNDVLENLKLIPFISQQLPLTVVTTGQPSIIIIDSKVIATIVMVGAIVVFDQVFFDVLTEVFLEVFYRPLIARVLL